VYVVWPIYDRVFVECSWIRRLLRFVSYCVDFSLISMLAQLKQGEQASAEQMTRLHVMTLEKQLTKQELENEKTDLIASVQLQHSQQLEHIQHAHSTAQRDLRTRLDASEALNGKLHKSTAALTLEVDALNNSILMHKKLVVEGNQSVEELKAALDRSEDECRRSQGRIDDLTAATRNKDVRISELQQLLQNAGEASSSSRQQRFTADADVSVLNMSVSDREALPHSNSARMEISDELPELAGDWAKVSDGLGNEYYFNTVTGESSWTIPTDGQNPTEVVTAGDWVQLQDTEGRTYWLNKVTNASQWELPKGVSSKSLQSSTGGYSIEL
jgi:hypothetical protein